MNKEFERLTNQIKEVEKENIELEVEYELLMNEIKEKEKEIQKLKKEYNQLKQIYDIVYWKWYMSQP